MNLEDIILSDVGSLAANVDPAMLANRSITVTGATGMIGTYFVATLAALKARGVPVSVNVVVHSSPMNYHTALFNRLSANVLQGSLTDMGFVSSIPLSDITIHAAGYAQPDLFTSDAVSTLAINTATTWQLAERTKPGGKFLYLSSSEVYSGLAGVHTEAQIGTTTPAHPRSCYIEGKRAGEAICRAYRERGIDAKAVRLALAYGPGTKVGDRRVMSHFIDQALRGQITMRDAGHAVRTYCYVRDAIDMMWHILLRGQNEVYNVGGESTVTIRQLATMIAEQLDATLTIPTEESALNGAPERVELDLSRVRSEFGKISFVSMEEGLSRTILWNRVLRETQDREEANL